MPVRRRNMRLPRRESSPRGGGARTRDVTLHAHWRATLHSSGCERAEEFAPRLEEVASKVPSIAYGRATAKVAASLAHGVAAGAPALKALFRNAPPNKRVLVYQGPPTVDAVLEWAKAVEKWDGSDTAPDGWFVSKEDFQKPASAKDEV